MTVQKLLKYIPYNINGKKLDLECVLKLNISDKSGNFLIHKNILRHNSIRNQKISFTKTRAEVQGGGKKPWKQKGTGRARAGSNNSPLWKGGGVIFGPKPKKIRYKLNKKERKLAVRTLLYNRKNNILIINSLENDFVTRKTHEFLKICTNCNININTKLLVIVSKKTSFLKYATNNIKNIELICANQLNCLSLLKTNTVLITPSALNDIKETFCE